MTDKLKDKGKKKVLRCVYCKCEIPYGLTCESCGDKEDFDLGKQG